MRTIIWFLYFWLYLVSVLPLMLYVKSKIKNGKKDEIRPIVQRVVQNWASRLLKAAGVTVTVDGAEHIPQEAALFVCNHQGNFDIPIVLCKLGPLKSVVAKKELAKLPGIHSWMTFFDCPFMDRDDPRQSLKCLNDAQALLKQGQSVVIFPEGTRSKGPQMGEFKPGALRCALKAQAPIVPVAINGSYRAMEEHGFSIRPAHVRITVLPPIVTKDMAKEHTRTISEEIHQMIAETLETTGDENR